MFLIIISGLTILGFACLHFLHGIGLYAFSLFIIFFIPGSLVITMYHKNKLGLFEFVSFSLFIGSVVTLMIMFFLYALEVFSPLMLIIVYTAFILIHLVQAIISKRIIPALVLKTTRNCLVSFLICFIIIFALLGFYQQPSEWILNYGMDASNYLVQAAYQIENNSYFFKDNQAVLYGNFFADANYKENSTTLISEGDPTRREFPFPPLWKTCLTLAMLLGGLEFALYLPLLISILIVPLFFILIKSLTNNLFYPALAAGLLVLSPLIIQFTRITTSEIFMLYFIVGSFALLLRNLDREDGKVALIAGISLALLPLIRSDFIFFYTGLTLALFISAFAGTSFAGTGLHSFSLSFFLFTAFFWFTVLYFSPHYTLIHLQEYKVLMDIAVVLVPVLYIGLIRLDKRYGCLTTIVTRLITSCLFRGVVAFCLLVFFVFSFYLRQTDIFARAIEATQHHGSWQRYDPEIPQMIMSYITPFTLVAGAIGSIILVLLKKWQALFILAALSGFTFLYIIIPFHSRTIFWTVRRFIPNVLPFFVLAGTVFLSFLDLKLRSQFRPVFKAILLIAVIISLTFSNINITNNNAHYLGATESFWDFSANFGQDDVVMIDGEMWLSDACQLGLKYYTGIEALSPYLESLSDDELVNFFKHLKNEGKQLLIIPHRDSRVRLETLFVYDITPVLITYYDIIEGEEIQHARQLDIHIIQSLR